MLAKITTPDLPQDYIEADLLIERHKEYKTEIESRHQVFSNFYATGQAFISKGHPLSTDIEDKIVILKQRMELLGNIWSQRNIIYNMNLDVQIFKRDATTLENWLILRESVLRDPKVGESIPQVIKMLK